MARDMDARTAEGASRPKPSAMTWIVVGCLVALLALSLLGSLMNVGDHLFGVHPTLGWIFYGLLVVLVALGVIVPIVQVARRPIFSLYQLRDEEGRARKRYCRLLADNLIQNGGLSDDEIAQVERALASDDRADDLLIDFFEERIVPGLDDETKRAASTAFFVAAISRSPLISTVTMLALCLDLVRNIVERCGFRPTNAGLARLYIRVMISALIIGGIEDSDLGDAMSQALGGGVGAHAGGLVIGAVAEGMVSAFLVFRVGIITKRWLTAADGPVRMRQLRRASYRESLVLMRDSGWATEVVDTLKKMTGTATAAAAGAVASAAGSAVGNATAAVAGAAGSVATSVAEAAREAAYPTTNAAGATFEGAFETAQDIVGRVRGIFGRGKDREGRR